MSERKLKIGAILKTRLVPAYATLQVGSDIKLPPSPKVGYKSAAGHTEYRDAPVDSAEWQTYSEQVTQIRTQIGALKSEFVFDYAVEAWSWDGGVTWLTDAPDDWTFPAVFIRHGIKPSENRRVDYIRYELLTANEDVATLYADALENAAPITNAEVDAASAGFRSDNARGKTAGGARHWYQRFKRALHRNEHGA